jgi:hypothetical protein
MPGANSARASAQTAQRLRGLTAALQLSASMHVVLAANCSSMKGFELRPPLAPTEFIPPVQLSHKEIARV